MDAYETLGGFNLKGRTQEVVTLNHSWTGH